MTTEKLYFVTSSNGKIDGDNFKDQDPTNTGKCWGIDDSGNTTLITPATYKVDKTQYTGLTKVSLADMVSNGCATHFTQVCFASTDVPTGETITTVFSCDVTKSSDGTYAWIIATSNSTKTVYVSTYTTTSAVWSAWKTSDGLPTTGGTMTGNIAFVNNTGIVSSDTGNESSVVLCGGSDSDSGGVVTINGNDVATGKGTVTIKANDGTDTSSLIVSTSEFTYNNKNILLDGDAICCVNIDEGGKTREELFAYTSEEKPVICLTNLGFSSDEAPRGASEGNWTVIVSRVGDSSSGYYGYMVAYSNVMNNVIAYCRRVHTEETGVNPWQNWVLIPLGLSTYASSETDITRSSLFGYEETYPSSTWFNNIRFTSAESPDGSDSSDWLVICSRVSATSGNIISFRQNGASAYMTYYNGTAWSTWSGLAMGNFLPLAGGTMTGKITSEVIDFIFRDGDSSAIAIYGGSSTSTGASIAIRGMGNGGSVSLKTRTSAGVAGGELSVKPEVIYWTGVGANVNNSVIVHSTDLTSQTRENIRTIINSDPYKKYNCLYIFPRVRFTEDESPNGSSGSIYLLLVFAYNSSFMSIKAVQGYGNNEARCTYTSGAWTEWTGVKHTPTAGTGVTLASNNCSYVQVDRMVYVWGILTLAAGTYASGQTLLSDLPQAASGIYGTGTLTCGNASYRLRIAGSATVITMLDALTVSSTSYCNFTFMYLAA